MTLITGEVVEALLDTLDSKTFGQRRAVPAFD